MEHLLSMIISYIIFFLRLISELGGASAATAAAAPGRRHHARQSRHLQDKEKLNKTRVIIQL